METELKSKEDVLSMYMNGTLRLPVKINATFKNREQKWASINIKSGMFLVDLKKQIEKLLEEHGDQLRT